MPGLTPESTGVTAGVTAGVGTVPPQVILNASKGVSPLDAEVALLIPHLALVTLGKRRIVTMKEDDGK